MLKGFKEFISRGSAIDLAVGMIIGAAFTAVVTSLVEGIINPLIGGIFGKPNFDTVLSFWIGDAQVLPGTVLTALVNFLLVAIALYFCIVVPMNKLAGMRRKPADDETSPELSDEAALLVEIRDLLAKAEKDQA